MSGLHKYDIDPAAIDPNGIAESQTVAAASSLALNGALSDLGTALQFDIGDAYSDGIGGVKLLFDAAGDINTAVFTITGKDQDGNSVTEAVTGVTTTAVSTGKYYSQVTEIAISVATATGCFVGTVTGELVTRTIPVNHYASHEAACAVSGLVGTCQFDLEETYDDMRVTTGDNAGWFVFSSNASTNIAATATLGATGVRLKFDSYTDGAELQFHVSYNPFR
jgi:hypothetical protein